MIDAIQARSIVLRHCEGALPAHDAVKFAIQSCEYSIAGRCWIVRANSEDYVVHGRMDGCMVGVNAYLVDVESGAIDAVGSGNSVAHYLQDRADSCSAGGDSYVLEPSFGSTDKAAVVRLRQALACTMAHALRMVAPRNRSWLTGKRRLLTEVHELLGNRGVSTTIALRANLAGAADIGERALCWEEVKAVLIRRQGELR